MFHVINVLGFENFRAGRGWSRQMIVSGIEASVTFLKNVRNIYKYDVIYIKILYILVFN
jgi:hypothetical protein